MVGQFFAGTRENVVPGGTPVGGGWDAPLSGGLSHHHRAPVGWVRQSQRVPPVHHAGGTIRPGGIVPPSRRTTRQAESA